MIGGGREAKMLQQAEWLVGLAFVMCYAHWRFATPRSNRTSTTWIRFVGADLAYIASTIALYIVLSGVITSVPKILNLFFGANLPAELTNESGPFAAALILTTLLPNATPLARVDGALLRWFQRLGRIPYEVLRWSQLLRKATLRMGAEAEREVRDFIEQRAELGWMTGCDLQFENTGTPAALFTRQIILFQKVSAWDGDPTHAGFLKEFDEDFEKLATRFAALAATAAKYFPLFRAGGVADATETEAVAELKSSFLAQCNRLNRDLTDFMARAILLSARTQRERTRCCRALGFEITEVEPTVLGPNELIAWIAFIFLMLVAGFQVFGAMFGVDITIRRTLFLAAMVATIYGGAAFTALVLKLRFDWARPSDDHRPYAGYFAAGIAGVLVAGMITLVLKTIYLLDFWKAALDFEFSYPWLIMAFATSTLISVLVDRFDELAQPVWARWADGVLLAIGLVAASYVVCEIFAEMQLPPGRGPPAFEYVAAVNAVVGFFMGAVIPHWYRQRLSRIGTSAPVGQPLVAT
jgi:hypothetical protein